MESHSLRSGIALPSQNVAAAQRRRFSTSPSPAAALLTGVEEPRPHQNVGEPFSYRVLRVKQLLVALYVGNLTVCLQSTTSSPGSDFTHSRTTGHSQCQRRRDTHLLCHRSQGALLPMAWTDTCISPSSTPAIPRSPTTAPAAPPPQTLAAATTPCCLPCPAIRPAISVDTLVTAIGVPSAPPAASLRRDALHRCAIGVIFFAVVNLIGPKVPQSMRRRRGGGGKGGHVVPVMPALKDSIRAISSSSSILKK